MTLSRSRLLGNSTQPPNLLRSEGCLCPSPLVPLHPGLGTANHWLLSWLLLSLALQAVLPDCKPTACLQLTSLSSPPTLHSILLHICFKSGVSCPSHGLLQISTWTLAPLRGPCSHCHGLSPVAFLGPVDPSMHSHVTFTELRLTGWTR